MTQDYSINRPFALYTNSDKNWVKEQRKNSAKYALYGAAIGTTTWAGMSILTRNTKSTSKVLNMFDTVVTKAGGLVNKVTKSNAATKYVDKITKLPGKYKIFGMAATLLLPAVSYLIHGQAYEAGKIDQKYNDMAQSKKPVTFEDIKEFYKNGGKGVRVN